MLVARGIRHYGIDAITVLVGPIIIGLLIAPSAGAIPQSGNPPGSHRHSSGLLVVDGDTDEAMPSSLADAYGIAWRTSQEMPNDFSFPRIEDGVVVLPAVSPDAAKIVGSDKKIIPEKLQTLAMKVNPSVMQHGRSVTEDSQAKSVLSGPINVVKATGNKGNSRNDITKVMDGAIDLAKQPTFSDAGIWESEYDPITGGVILSVEILTDQLAERLVKDYGTDMVAVRELIPPKSYPTAGRQSDSKPYWGGALIGVPGHICTSGFSWVSGSTSMMLTAGHCLPSGGSVTVAGTTIGSVASGSAENWTAGLGTVLIPGQSVYRGDLALITLSSAGASNGRMYTGGPSSSTYATVKEMWSRSPANGDQFCTGGVVSGEVCGWTVSKFVDHVYSNNEVLRHGVESKTKQGQCLIGGDSGGPVYTVRSDGAISAKGIVSGISGGGADYWGGLLDPCTMWFTDIYDAYYAFPGVLATA
jgi:hypothetical protein